MKNIKFLVLMAVILAAMTFMAPKSFADGETGGDYMRGMGANIGRGLWNIISSPAEIPCGIRDDMKVDANTGFFTGLGKGTWFMLRRILVGVDEIGTLMIPMERTLPNVCQG